MTQLPHSSLCKRGSVIGRESGFHRLAIVQADRYRLLQRGKTKTCSQGHTCCFTVYRNTLERVSARKFLFAL